jgi:hypothetical protein
MYLGGMKRRGVRRHKRNWARCKHFIAAKPHRTGTAGRGHLCLRGMRLGRWLRWAEKIRTWHIFNPVSNRDWLAMDEARIRKVPWSLKATTIDTISMNLQHGFFRTKHPKRLLWKCHTGRTCDETIFGN